MGGIVGSLLPVEASKAKELAFDHLASRDYVMTRLRSDDHVLDLEELWHGLAFLVSDEKSLELIQRAFFGASHFPDKNPLDLLESDIIGILSDSDVQQISRYLQAVTDTQITERYVPEKMTEIFPLDWPETDEEYDIVEEDILPLFHEARDLYKAAADKNMAMITVIFGT